MADEMKHQEPFDEYIDAFTVTITPFGANISFAVREAHPAAARVPQSLHLGTLRMSVEHLKTMVIMLRRQIIQVEQESGVHAEVPTNILNQLGISPEDWQAFWRMD